MSKQVKDLNTKLIRTIKKELKTISVTALAKKLDWTRQNIHWHLRKENIGLITKTEYLNKIFDAIQSVKKDKETSDHSLINTVSKKLETI